MNHTQQHLCSILLLLAIVCILVYVIRMIYYQTEGFATEDAYKKSAAYNKQVDLLKNTYGGGATGKRPLLQGVGDMPDSHQTLINFYSLGCRFAGFVGPSEDSNFDPDIAVQHAVQAGCRTFVLEIDYIEKCCNDSEYFPTLVVYDSQKRLRTNLDSIKNICNSNAYSTIRDTCEKINFYAFAESCQNKTDPIMLVLYFIRQPPGGYKDPKVLAYYSTVAKMIKPLSTRFLRNEESGTYYRQRQEGKLLINKIASYNGKVIICSNANTSGFRELPQPYAAEDDLDYLVNLRLSYTQTPLGITDNTSGSTFGILETVEDYTIIPDNRKNTVIQQTTNKWTICLATDPFKTVSAETYHKITQTYGVHCVPIILYDIPANQYMFTDKLFQTYSFIPKPLPLRNIKPPVVVAAEPNPSTNGKQGKLADLRTPGQM